MEKTKSTPPSFYVLVSVFFFWGFLAASKDIFIPFCKSHFNLSQPKAMLVDSAFYGAYFIGSLLLYFISLRFKLDIINRLGYKNTIVMGLMVSVSGALLMIPSVNAESFPFILVSYFLIALGFSLQQTSANPLVLNLGNPAQGSNRLNFAGSINSLGTYVGPIIVSLILFGMLNSGSIDKTAIPLSKINVLFVTLAVAFLFASAVFYFSKIPNLSIEDKSETKMLKAPVQFILGVLLALGCILLALAFRIVNDDHSIFLLLIVLSALLFCLFLFLLFYYQKNMRANSFEAAKYPQIVLGMIAIFTYVGVEVTVGSNLNNTIKKSLDFASIFNLSAADLSLSPAELDKLLDKNIAPYIALYWGSLMIGRWTGSLGAFNLKPKLRFILTIALPLVAFGFIVAMNAFAGADNSGIYLYVLCVAVLIGAFLYTKQQPVKTLLVFSILAGMAMMVGILSSGVVSIYAFMSGGLFCSIMWPSIFSLATAGLGKYTAQASGFLIMMILGGAFIPPLHGAVGETIGMQKSYFIAAILFALLAFLALRFKSVLEKQGINYDEN